MKLIEEIKKHSPGAALALLIRHADRDRIPDGEFGNEIMINETGKANSIAFGESLKDFPIQRILSSPIQRCIQTAEYITKGLGIRKEVISTRSLGDPGLHISDEETAGRFYLQNGFDEMYRRYRNEESIPGVPDSKTFFEMMTAFIHTNMSEKGITIFITHDSLIAFYRYSLDKTIYTTENWVEYLGGVIIKKEENESV